MIAELTGNRNGVYYEAGYATALGKEVIVAYREGEKVHFDSTKKCFEMENRRRITRDA